MNEMLLKAKMVEHGVTDHEMADIIGIDASSFYRKKCGKSDFFRKEIQAMKIHLGLSGDDIDRIFFDR